MDGKTIKIIVAVLCLTGAVVALFAFGVIGGGGTPSATPEEIEQNAPAMEDGEGTGMRLAPVPQDP